MIIFQQSRVGIKKIIKHFRPKTIQQHLGARVANLGLDSVKNIAQLDCHPGTVAHHP